MSKDIKVIKYEENEITLQEVSRYKTFYYRYGKYIVLLIILSLLFIGGTVILSLKKSNEYVLDNPGVNIVFPDGDDVIIGEDDKPSGDTISGDKPSTDNKDNVVKDPEDLFDDFFGVPDEVCFKVKQITLSDKKIYYYSDYSVKIVYNNGNIVRVLPIDNKYSVDELSNINNSAKKSSIKVIKKEKTNHGTITYYSDFSAEVEENDLDIWVGKKDNIKEYYITENKISYSNDIKEYNNFSVTYYNDGTIFIDGNNEKYFVRNKDDVVITDNGYLFTYNNAATVISTKKLDNGFTIDYLSDGGAIIKGLEGNVSVRKSNSIVIEDNKLIKIKTNNVVKETSKKSVENKEVIYYDNGTAIIIQKGDNVDNIEEDDNVIGYFPENSDIKYTNDETDDKIINENEMVPKVNTSNPNEDTEINVFEDGNAIIKEPDKTIFEEQDNVVIENGVVAIIDADAQKINVSRIKITNNTVNKVKIRIVFENSKNTTLQNYYFKDVKYKISEDNLTKSINNNPWDDKGYILYETELNSKDSKDYELGMWLDYTDLGNDAMDKYFYGTLKVYSWEQK